MLAERYSGVPELSLALMRRTMASSLRGSVVVISIVTRCIISQLNTWSFECTKLMERTKCIRKAFAQHHRENELLRN
jgi:hypothetical protein